MMVLPSPYSVDTGGATTDAVGYPIDEAVYKPDGNGRQRFQRVPAPEVLIGDPVLMRAAIRIAPGQHKYRSLVISFAEGDIDVKAFNAGSREARVTVEKVLGLYCEIAFAGIPKPFRPPILVATHTHCGNLELNIVIPRWIRRSDGERRAFNPDPPGFASRDDFDAFEDLLNTEYGWSDPRDPARRQLFTLPGFLAKKRASVQRSGGEWQPTTREIICDRIAEAVLAKEIKSRADVELWLAKHTPEYNMTVLKVADHHITIGAEDALARDRIKLSGVIFSRDFLSPEALTPKGMVLDKKARAARLVDAAARLQVGWERRAAFNLDRYGLWQWPDPAFDAASFLNQPSFRSLCTIPPSRLDRAVKHQEEETRHDQRHEHELRVLVGADPYGTGAPEPGRGTGADAPSRPANAERNDRGAGGRDPGEERSHHPLDALVGFLAGPQGPGSILTSFARRLRKVFPSLIARLTFQNLLPVIPQNLSHHLQQCEAALENMNAAHVRQLAARRCPEDCPGNRPEARPDPQSDHAASRAAASPGVGGTRPDPAADRYPPELLQHRDTPSDGSSDAYQAFRDRPAAEGRGAGLPVTGGQDRGARRTYRGAAPRSEFDDVVVLNADEPAVTRAQVISRIRQLAEVAEPGARISLRLLRGEPEDIGSQDDARRSLISLVPDETWVLTGSDVVLDAVEEALGLVEDEPAIEDDGTSFDPF